MLQEMRAPILNLKILDSVIGLVAVDVMNDFIPGQQSSKMISHDQSVLQYVSGASCTWMIGSVQRHVSSADYLAPFPSIGSRSSPPQEMHSCHAALSHGLNYTTTVPLCQ